MLAVFALGGLGGYAAGRASERTPPARSAYRAETAAPDPDRTEFLASYARAEQAGELWTRDPIAVGLRSAGYPNPDNLDPDQVRAWYPTPGQATIVVLAEGLGDDSVAARERRIDLEREGGGWRIIWSGSRFRCVRDLTLGWTADLCS
ncbi:MAG TPA: hypothetical protein VGE07_23180 [Herpetosiphonaceae bacterium]